MLEGIPSATVNLRIFFDCTDSDYYCSIFGQSRHLKACSYLVQRIVYQIDETFGTINGNDIRTYVNVWQWMAWIAK
jgi:hypothetical protein